MNGNNDSERPVLNLEPELEAAVRSVLSEPVPADAVARVLARAAALRPGLAGGSMNAHTVAPIQEFNPTTIPPTRSPFFSRSLLMKSLSTVAAIVVVGGAALLLQSSPSAYAQAIKQLREARSFSYTKQIHVEGNPKPIEVKIMVAEDGRQRQEMASGTISIMDPSPQIRLTLIDGTKTAIVNEPQEFPPGAPKNHPVEWLDSLKSHGDKPDKQLGKKVLNGRNVEGFEVLLSQFVYTIWIDSQTKELVQVEHDMGVKGSSISKVVMSDFRFHQKLDESLFSFDVPKGYKTINQGRLELPKTAGGESSILEALRGFTKKSSGKFPKSITEWGEWAVLFSQGSTDGKLGKEAKEVMGHVGSIMPFLIGLPKTDYEYRGAGKTVDDDRCIVFWYRNKDGKFRAIYNDLTVADVEEKDVR